jgi:hypothetical protein
MLRLRAAQRLISIWPSLAAGVAVITQQSTLLLQALAERAELLRDLQRAAAPATDDMPSEKA